MYWLADEIDDPASDLHAAPKAIEHLEKMMRSLLLESLAPACPRAIPADNGATPRTVRRVEEWIDAHFADAVGIEDLAAIGGIGARGLQRAFQRHRGCSPMEALAQRRLAAARALLSAPEPATTVTAVALDVGFGHFGRFAARYRATFGEPPSATLARARRG